jgi:prevent-host-death family protein
VVKRIWQLQEAKNKLSQVVDEAVAHGPQIITRHGQETAVVLSMNEYERLVKGRKSLREALSGAPGELPVQRDKTSVRATRLG